jgi:hypothetical protein
MMRCFEGMGGVVVSGTICVCADDTIHLEDDAYCSNLPQKKSFFYSCDFLKSYES